MLRVIILTLTQQWEHRIVCRHTLFMNIVCQLNVILSNSLFSWRSNQCSPYPVYKEAMWQEQWAEQVERRYLFLNKESESKNQHLTIDSRYRLFRQESVVSRIGIDPSLTYFLDYWTQFDFTSHVNSQIQCATSIDQA